MKKMYGIVETNEVKTEKYTTVNKKGNSVTKTRKVNVPKSLVVPTEATDRLGALQEVRAVAKSVEGKVSFIGAFG